MLSLRLDDTMWLFIVLSSYLRTQFLITCFQETQAAEKFYGGLMEKIDAILLPLGAGDPGCRERAVCTLYGDPFKHAPYSNLVSNELSKWVSI